MAQRADLSRKIPYPDFKVLPRTVVHIVIAEAAAFLVEKQTVLQIIAQALEPQNVPYSGHITSSGGIAFSDLRRARLRMRRLGSSRR